MGVLGVQNEETLLITLLYFENTLFTQVEGKGLKVEISDDTWKTGPVEKQDNRVPFPEKSDLNLDLH